MLQTSMKRVQAHQSDIISGRNKRKMTATSTIESEEDGSRSHAGEDGASKNTLISFERVLSPNSIHTAECCRLSLPRAFCERYFDMGGAVTVTDSAGTRMWHMRFQSRAHAVFTISNGWREFSYDHGLKVMDRVVFTRLSASHFRVEFAASARRMLATRDGDKYPWRINSARLNCLSSVKSSSIRIKDGMRIRVKDDEQKIQKDNRRRRPSCAGLIRVKEPADEDARLTSEEQGVRKNAMADRKMEMKFCRCDMAMARKGAAKSKYVIPELTHVECKNADGSSYLQIVDSDTENS